MRAILSVYDKTGVVAFGKKLSDSGVNIISTGGTYKQLSDSKIEVTAVKEVTGFPEILDGRVKTLHPKIYGVMGKGTAKLIKEKNKVLRIEKRILLRYFKTLNNKSARELIDDTDCIIEIVPKKYSVWKY